MITEEGSYRKVFIFNKVVVKVPIPYIYKMNMQDYTKYKEYKLKYFLEGWRSNIYEILNWYKSFKNKELKSFLCPIRFHFIFGMFIIMAKAEVFYDVGKKITPKEEKYINTLREKYKDNPIFNDCQPCNLGLYKGKVVKIDYGDNNNRLT